MSKTVVDISTLKINILSQAQYEAEVAGGTVAEDELYFTPSLGSGVSDVEVDGVSVVTGGVAEIDLTDTKVFLVTLTEVGDDFVSDKTAKQIYDAFNAGRVVLLKVYGSYVLLSSVYGDNNYYQAVFNEFQPYTSSIHRYQYIIVTNNDVTTVDYNDYATSINNATLRIQKNGTTVNSFTANASSDVTANIIVPTKVSELTNDSGFLTAETDPTVPTWAKQPTKPSYTASEVGALPSSTTIPSKTSDLINDSGFLTLADLPVYSGGVS